MVRSNVDRLLSALGLLLTLLLLVAGGLALWARLYSHIQVHDQLAAQKIYFPPANSPRSPRRSSPRCASSAASR
jgi:hypothetical protein